MIFRQYIVMMLIGAGVLYLSACEAQDIKAKPMILTDQAYISDTKKRISQQEPAVMPAYNQLMRQAEAALHHEPYSVTDKEKLAPSGDPHDYVSYSRYWWPDPDQEDGLPFIRRDGETNPDSQSPTKSDRPKIGALAKDTEALGLAYYFTGDLRYAQKTASLIRTWFLDEATYMHPRLNHAQCRPGHNSGSKSGVLDGRLMITALEASLLISDSGALSQEEYEQLKVWVSKYVTWLITDNLALQEAASTNNHGCYYDVQVLYCALYSGQMDIASELARGFTESRIEAQIEADGSMPEELARTRPLFYSMYNLHAMFLVAHLADHLDVDLWRSDAVDSGLRAALDYLSPYADPNVTWPQEQIGPDNRMELYPLLMMADRVYPDGDYLKMTQLLPVSERMTQLSNLAMPLMR